MRISYWTVLVCLATLFAAGPATAGPIAGLAGAARPAVATPLLEKVGHRHRWRQHYAPYAGYYVRPRYYYAPYVYSYRYRVPAYDYYYEPAPYRYYYQSRRHRDDDDWDDDWDD